MINFAERKNHFNELLRRPNFIWYLMSQLGGGVMTYFALFQQKIPPRNGPCVIHQRNTQRPPMLTLPNAAWASRGRQRQ